MKPKVAIPFVLALCTAPLCSAVSLIVLDTFDGGPTAISPDGSIVLVHASDGTFRWERGTVQYLSDSRWELYYDMTADGQLLVGSHYSNAIVRDAVGLTQLVLPDASNPSGAAIVVSADGSVIAGYVSPSSTSSGGREAAMWIDGVLTGLGQLVDTGESQTTDMSADGTVIIGRAQPPDVTNQWVPFRWEAGVMTNLGHPQEGNRATFAHAISGDGRYIVGSSEFSDFDERGFIWENGTYTILEHPDPANIGSVVQDISDDGSVLVGYTSAPGDWTYAAIWILEEGSYTALYLEEFLDNNGVDRMGFEIFEVRDVSADGSTIVGQGWYPDIGNTETFIVSLADPPQWGGYDLRSDGRSIDTGQLLGIIDIANAPWIYAFDLDMYLFIEENALSEPGGWIWVPR